ncbi:GNAT family N-acetyltransferase [Alkalicoccobacillus murimartini]|uniref:Ribosomal-protein-alanine N-acetyltransferase n=1 Tax=Alkalicoccobacillus murimartini TaxID=171685 RepID=A0ABT9YNY2_9BACI|nr:GNAT family protein [Alkalicoccobacillus murimartini]MDQ0208739.1 ribosomal-protein-alanine N-acetyltransferase [Alkalicoccobacillus murimartini]
MNLSIKMLKAEDEELLYHFEKENRAYFEEMIPGRGDDYYDLNQFKKNHLALLNEQEENKSYFYLIKNDLAEIVGRINVVDLNEQGVGSIGYRVGKRFIGQGVATQAIRLLLQEVKGHPHIRIIEAKTTTNHLSSQKVLEKNGFEKIGISEDTYQNALGEEWPFVHFRRVICEK